MARGINLAFLADVRDFLRGTQSASDALDDIGHALDTVVTDSAQAQQDMSADFTKIASDANTAGDKVSTSFDGVGRAGVDSSGKVREGFRGTGDELQQEALQGAASFDGSMTSAAGSAQAFSSVALSAFGPIGTAIGVAAAAGFGAWRAQAARAKQAVDDLFDALVSGQGKLNDAFRQTQLQEWAKDGTLEKLARQADDLGISYGTAVRAAMGAADAVAAVQDATDRQTRAQGDLTVANAQAGAAIAAQTRANTGLKTTAEQAAQVVAEGRDQFDLYARAASEAGVALDGTTDSMKDSTDATDTNTRSLQDNVGAVLDGRRARRDYQQALDDATAALKENGKTLDIHTEKGRRNQDALDAIAEAAAADGKIRRDEIKDFEAAAHAMGLQADAAEKLARKLGLIPTEIKTKVTLDINSAETQRQLSRLGYRWDNG